MSDDVDFTARFYNEQETFDWLEANVKNWQLVDENVIFVDVSFATEEDEIFARESLRQFG